MKIGKALSSVGLVTAAALTLVACGKNSGNGNAAKQAGKFPEQTPVKAVKAGGTLSYAIETDTPFTEIGRAHV